MMALHLMTNFVNLYKWQVSLGIGALLGGLGDIIC